MHDLTASAATRAGARAPGFRAAGWWGTEPVDLVRAAAARDPERVALVERGRSLTYSALDAAVDRAVAALRAEGVDGGDALLLLVGNDVASVVAIHAALRAGALTMVAPTSAGSAQIRDIVAMTEPMMTLAPEPMLPTTVDERGPTRWVTLGTVGNAAPDSAARSPGRDPDEPSMVIFT